MDSQTVIGIIVAVFVAPVAQYYITEFLVSRKARKSSSEKMDKKAMNLFETIKQNTPKKEIVIEFFVNLAIGIFFLVLAIIFISSGVDDFIKTKIEHMISVSLPCFMFAFMGLTNASLFFLAAVSDEPKNHNLRNSTENEK